MKKMYRILLNDPVPEKFDYLPDVDQIQTWNGKNNEIVFDAVIIVDASDLNRLGQVRNLISDGTETINIDHHPSNQRYGTIDLIDSSASSTAEIIYDLVKWSRIPISQEMATLIFTGIMCDTGRFLFPNTTYRSFSICSEMVQLGVSPSLVSENIYFRSSQETVKALATALSTLEFHFNGAVSCIHLPYAVCSQNGFIDTEGFVDYLLSIDKTEVEFFMHEKMPNSYKISFRSKNYVDVNQVAKELGGGGHVRASGCTIEGNLDEIRQKILRVLKNHIEK